MTQGDFDVISQNIAEAVDAIMSAPRSRARRIELIAHQIRRALILGYRAAKTSRFKEDESHK